MSCTSTPISWLRLERFHLGECPSDEAKSIKEHLASCAVCKKAFAEIAGDEPQRSSVVRGPWYSRPTTVAAMSALALAAIILLVIGRTPRIPEDQGGARTKGDDVAFTLVRENESIVPEAGGPYRDGDRFKALVTCPPGMRATWDVVVYEGDQASFPLAMTKDLACGNQVALPGAFRVTGHRPMTVCLVWSDTELNRDGLATAPPSTARCVNLEPAP